MNWQCQHARPLRAVCACVCVRVCLGGDWREMLGEKRQEHNHSVAQATWNCTPQNRRGGGRVVV